MTNTAPSPFSLDGIQDQLPRPVRRPWYIAGVFMGLALSMTSAALIAMGNNGSAPARPPAVQLTLIIMGLIVIAVSAILLGHHVGSTRRAAFEIAMNHVGLTPVSKPNKADRERLFAPFSHLKSLRHGARGLRYAATGVVGGRRYDTCEHLYMVHTGKAAHAVIHSVASTPCSFTWPRIAISKRTTLGSLFRSSASRSFKLENPAFNERWSIDTTDPEFAALVLSPEVQQYMLEGPSFESWEIGSGRVCWLARKALKSEDSTLGLQRLAGLLALLPPELDAW